MTLTVARQILGLDSDENTHSNLQEFKAVREHLAGMVRRAPNEILAERYQQELMDFDKALAAVREHLEATGLAVSVPDRLAAAALPKPDAPIPAATEELPPRRHAAAVLAWLFILLLAVLGGGWFYLDTQEKLIHQRQARIALLQREGAAHIENRRWSEAAADFNEIEQLSPNSQIVPLGQRSIEVGMVEEQQQFAGYWTGQAHSSLDAGRWDEAENAVRQVLGKFPDDKESATLLKAIASARAGAARRQAIITAREFFTRRQWDAAIQAANRILATQSDDQDASALLAEAMAAKTNAANERSKARKLFQQAVARDQGQFDQQALDWLREASALVPEDPEIASFLEKMASYTRTLRVPKDFPTPAEALANAHDRDRIILSEGTWKGPFSVNASIEIQGAGADKTRIECPAESGCAMTLGPLANGSRLSGISFRHESQTADATRFSALLIRSAAVTLLDCHFIDACGHGLAVIEGGKVNATRCRFTDNGWDGAAAIGAGSVLDIRDSHAIGNFEHGIESWNEASVVLINNRCEANSRNGIHADSGKSSATIEGNQLIDNREFGLVIGSAGSGGVLKNTARGNLLGGFVVRAVARIPVAGNQINHNQGPGLTLENGLDPSLFADNSLSGNVGKPILTDFVFSALEPPPNTGEQDVTGDGK